MEPSFIVSSGIDYEADAAEFQAVPRTQKPAEPSTGFCCVQAEDGSGSLGRPPPSTLQRAQVDFLELATRHGARGARHRVGH